MAKVTPAFITWTPRVDGKIQEQQKLNFHALMKEDHEVSAELTQYPVQEGLHITNHSIRRNRKITLDFEISNIVMNTRPLVDDGGNPVNVQPRHTLYGIKSTETVAEICKYLVQSAQQCEVTTNLGIYKPVVFTNFKTTQQPGKVDSMLVHLSGEEIVVVDDQTGPSPAPVIWEEVTGADRTLLEEELRELNIFVSERQKLRVSKVQMHKGFSIEEINRNTKKRCVVQYNPIQFDPVMGTYRNEMEVNKCVTDVAGGAEPPLKEDTCAKSGFASSLRGGLQQVGSCVVADTVNALQAKVVNKVQTAIGDLVQKGANFLYDKVSAANEAGGLIGSAIAGCVVKGAGQYLEDVGAGAIGEIVSGNVPGVPGISSFPNSLIPPTYLPTSDDVLRSNWPKREFPRREDRLIHIVCDDEGYPVPDINQSLIPTGLDL